MDLDGSLLAEQRHDGRGSRGLPCFPVEIRRVGRATRDGTLDTCDSKRSVVTAKRRDRFAFGVTCFACRVTY
jgi:hypothetical protein